MSLSSRIMAPYSWPGGIGGLVGGAGLAGEVDDGLGMTDLGGALLGLEVDEPLPDLALMALEVDEPLPGLALMALEVDEPFLLGLKSSSLESSSLESYSSSSSSEST